jgi:ABC-2 type transport system permease protein
MHFIKHLLLFIQNNFKQLQRKWFTLPLLFVFPILIVGLIVTIIASFFIVAENDPIQVGLVDLDQSNETQLVVDLIDEASQLGTFIQIAEMTEEEAIGSIKDNQLSAYITFPKNFTTDLYQGNTVTLPITGNPERPTESYLIKELIGSVARHIRSAQANILTINSYASEMTMDQETRNDIVFEQFKDYLFYTIGRDKIINDKEILNSVTASPTHYYGVAGWFIIVTIWLFSMDSFLVKEDTLRMWQRMRLCGVTALQQIMARIFVTLTMVGLFAVILFFLLQKWLILDMDMEDYWRIALITLLYSFIFLQILAVISLLILSQKLRLLGQSVITGLLLIFSGAIIPTLYFPVWLQAPIKYSYANEGFHWLQEIILHERLYADYIPLLLMNAAGLFMLIGLSLWKERAQR